MKADTEGPALPEHEDMKARAYALKLATGEKLGHCYEELAKQYGFKTYAAMRQAMQTRSIK